LNRSATVFYIVEMEKTCNNDPIVELVAASGFHRRRVEAAFDAIDGDDPRQVAKALDTLAALLAAGATESSMVAEFRRRCLGDPPLALRMHMIRARQAVSA
jgi:hypothetical protein